jgi:hypothetical protein
MPSSMSDESFSNVISWAYTVAPFAVVSGQAYALRATGQGRRSIDQPESHRLGDRCGSIADSEFRVEAVEMTSNG